MSCNEIAFFQGRDNWQIAGLLQGSANTPLTSAQLSIITRVRLEKSDGTKIADYADTPAAFSWPMEGEYWEGTAYGIGVNLDLAGLEPFAQTSVRLVIYDPDHPRGYVWAEGLQVEYKT